MNAVCENTTYKLLISLYGLNDTIPGHSYLTAFASGGHKSFSEHNMLILRQL